MLGRRVVVYGGGNTAIDVARTARRLGATDAIIVYRRTREKMPAHDFELEEALEEGVKVKWLSTITGAEGGKLTIEKMVLDADGKPQPTGEFETLDADSLVLALGQDVDMSLAGGHPGPDDDGWRGAGRSGDHDDRPSGPVCRRRHGAGRSAMSPSPSATARRPRAISTPGCAAQALPPKPLQALAAFDKLNTWYYCRRTRRPCARNWTSRAAPPALTRCRAG